MKCKEIPDVPILEFLISLNGRSANWYIAEDGTPWNNWSVLNAMPPETPHKVAHAKMRKLIMRGLVDGCPCGCRGDFEITDKGREYLRACSSLEEHCGSMHVTEGGAFDSAQAH